jgi:arsenate reductase
MQPRALMRRKEKAYEAFGPDDPALTREQPIRAMVEHPRFIERPIVVRSDRRAALGRRPEAALELL